MRTLPLLFAALLLVLLVASGSIVAQETELSFSDAEIEQIAEEVLSEVVQERKRLFRKLVNKKPAAKVAILSDAEAGLTVTIDSHSNEYWIQLQISPAKTVVSAQVIKQQTGQVFAAPNADWDHGNGANFVGKPGDIIPFGSKVTIRCFLRSGGQADIPMTWNQGARASSAGGSSSGPTGGSSPSTPAAGQNEFWKQPSSKNNLVQGAINKVHNFRRNGGPSAQITGEDDLRRRNKQRLNQACNDLGINDLKTRATIFALFTLESEQMYYSNGEAQRDTGKDHDWLSKNYSPLNMNVDMLQHIGVNKSKFESLNKIGNIKDTVHTLLVAFDKLGLEGFLNFHRGGRTGYNHPNDAKFKIPVFKDGVFNIMQKYVQDTSLFTDGRKVWANIPYV